ncbi:hypothetical protein B0H14DRAFT_3594001 [Mycena olivaceomarginata]|nr:hypothetical protein B0H14DRAFT_3594001 [Mycena olivaceomarginata]
MTGVIDGAADSRWYVHGVPMISESDEATVFQVAVGNIPAKEQVEIEPVYATELSEDEENDSMYFIDITVSIESITSIAKIGCPSHTVSTELGPDSTLPNFKRPPLLQRLLDKDLVLTVKGLDAPRCVAELHPDPSHDTVALALTFVPRFKLPDLARQEFTFLVDCSGSMDGAHISAARKALIVMLRSLLHKDSLFQIMFFGSDAASPLAGRQQGLQPGEPGGGETRHVDRMEADYGRTEMRSALRLDCSQDCHFPRLHVEGAEIELPIPVTLSCLQNNPGAPTAIHALAARKIIQDLEDEQHALRTTLSNPDDTNLLARTVKASVVRLGKTYSISSKHTSFVAVDETTPLPVHRSCGSSSSIPHKLCASDIETARYTPAPPPPMAARAPPPLPPGRSAAPPDLSAYNYNTILSLVFNQRSKRSPSDSGRCTASGPAPSPLVAPTRRARTNVASRFLDLEAEAEYCDEGDGGGLGIGWGGRRGGRGQLQRSRVTRLQREVHIVHVPELQRHVAGRGAPVHGGKCVESRPTGTFSAADNLEPAPPATVLGPLALAPRCSASPRLPTSSLRRANASSSVLPTPSRSLLPPPPATPTAPVHLLPCRTPRPHQRPCLSVSDAPPRRTPRSSTPRSPPPTHAPLRIQPSPAHLCPAPPGPAPRSSRSTPGHHAPVRVPARSERVRTHGCR